MPGETVGTAADAAAADAGADPLALRAQLFGEIFVLAGRLTTRMDRALAELDLTTRQWLLLAVVDTRFPGEGPTLSEAAAAYGSSRQNVKAIAEQLAVRGWLRLERDPTDRRATRLTLTDRIEVFRRPDLQRRAQELLDAVYGDLRDDDVAVLASLVGRWLGHLTPPG